MGKDTIKLINYINNNIYFGQLIIEKIIKEINCDNLEELLVKKYYEYSKFEKRINSIRKNGDNKNKISINKLIKIELLFKRTISTSKLAKYILEDINSTIIGLINIVNEYNIKDIRVKYLAKNYRLFLEKYAKDIKKFII